MPKVPNEEPSTGEQPKQLKNESVSKLLIKSEEDNVGGDNTSIDALNALHEESKPAQNKKSDDIQESGSNSEDIIMQSISRKKIIEELVEANNTDQLQNMIGLKNQTTLLEAVNKLDAAYNLSKNRSMYEIFTFDGLEASSTSVIQLIFTNDTAQQAIINVYINDNKILKQNEIYNITEANFTKDKIIEYIALNIPNNSQLRSHSSKDTNDNNINNDNHNSSSDDGITHNVAAAAKQEKTCVIIHTNNNQEHIYDLYDIQTSRNYTAALSNIEKNYSLLNQLSVLKNDYQDIIKYQDQHEKIKQLIYNFLFYETNDLYDTIKEILYESFVQSFMKKTNCYDVNKITKTVKELCKRLLAYSRNNACNDIVKNKALEIEEALSGWFEQYIILLRKYKIAQKSNHSTCQGGYYNSLTQNDLCNNKDTICTLIKSLEEIYSEKIMDYINIFNRFSHEMIIQSKNYKRDDFDKDKKITRQALNFGDTNFSIKCTVLSASNPRIKLTTSYKKEGVVIQLPCIIFPVISCIDNNIICQVLNINLKSIENAIKIFFNNAENKFVMSCPLSMYINGTHDTIDICSMEYINTFTQLFCNWLNSMKNALPQQKNNNDSEDEEFYDIARIQHIAAYILHTLIANSNEYYQQNNIVKYNIDIPNLNNDDKSHNYILHTNKDNDNLIQAINIYNANDANLIFSKYTKDYQKYHNIHFFNNHNWNDNTKYNLFNENNIKFKLDTHDGITLDQDVLFKEFDERGLQCNKEQVLKNTIICNMLIGIKQMMRNAQYTDDKNMIDVLNSTNLVGLRIACVNILHNIFDIQPLILHVQNNNINPAKFILQENQSLTEEEIIIGNRYHTKYFLAKLDKSNNHDSSKKKIIVSECNNVSSNVQEFEFSTFPEIDNTQLKIIVNKILNPKIYTPIITPDSIILELPQNNTNTFTLTLPAADDSLLVKNMLELVEKNMLQVFLNTSNQLLSHLPIYQQETKVKNTKIYMTYMRSSILTASTYIYPYKELISQIFNICYQENVKKILQEVSHQINIQCNLLNNIDDKNDCYNKLKNIQDNIDQALKLDRYDKFNNLLAEAKEGITQSKEIILSFLKNQSTKIPTAVGFAEIFQNIDIYNDIDKFAQTATNAINNILTDKKKNTEKSVPLKDLRHSKSMIILRNSEVDDCSSGHNNSMQASYVGKSNNFSDASYHKTENNHETKSVQNDLHNNLDNCNSHALNKSFNGSIQKILLNIPQVEDNNTLYDMTKLKDYDNSIKACVAKHIESFDQNMKTLYNICHSYFLGDESEIKDIATKTLLSTYNDIQTKFKTQYTQTLNNYLLDITKEHNVSEINDIYNDIENAINNKIDKIKADIEEKDRQTKQEQNEMKIYQLIDKYNKQQAKNSGTSLYQYLKGKNILSECTSKLITPCINEYNSTHRLTNINFSIKKGEYGVLPTHYKYTIQFNNMDKLYQKLKNTFLVDSKMHLKDIKIPNGNDVSETTLQCIEICNTFSFQSSKTRSLPHTIKIYEYIPISELIQGMDDQNIDIMSLLDSAQHYYAWKDKYLNKDNTPGYHNYETIKYMIDIIMQGKNSMSTIPENQNERSNISDSFIQEDVHKQHQAVAQSIYACPDPSSTIHYDENEYKNTQNKNSDGIRETYSEEEDDRGNIIRDAYSENASSENDDIESEEEEDEENDDDNPNTSDKAEKEKIPNICSDQAAKAEIEIVDNNASDSKSMPQPHYEHKNILSQTIHIQDDYYAPNQKEKLQNAIVQDNNFSDQKAIYDKEVDLQNEINALLNNNQAINDYLNAHGLDKPKEYRKYLKKYISIYNARPKGNFTNTNINKYFLIETQDAFYADFIKRFTNKYKINEQDFINTILPQFILSKSKMELINNSSSLVYLPGIIVINQDFTKQDTIKYDIFIREYLDRETCNQAVVLLHKYHKLLIPPTPSNVKYNPDNNRNYDILAIFCKKEKITGLLVDGIDATKNTAQYEPKIQLGQSDDKTISNFHADDSKYFLDNKDQDVNVDKIYNQYLSNNAYNAEIGEEYEIIDYNKEKKSD